MTTEIEVDEDVFLPCYQHLRDDAGIDIDLIYGGRDSGKSRDEAQRLVLRCLESSYFRYILVRKGANTIKDSQYQTIKDVVFDWGLQSLFTFNISPLEIRCVNGNKFIARGLDEPAKLKSISNPSGAWVEEGNQITEEDFIFLISSLRSNMGGIKLDFTFNPECDTPDYTDFWIYKNFFSHTSEKSFTHTKTYEVGGNSFSLTYRATHTTYHDNPFITPQRTAIHESFASTNYYWYNVFTLGNWGNKLNESPWAFAFSREKHVRPDLMIDHALPLIISFDFNRNPISCVISQHYRHLNRLCVLESIKIQNSGVDELCEQILVKYPGSLYIVTGDNSGHNRQSILKEQVTHYTMIQHKLRISPSQIKTRVNPRLEDNRTLVNLVLQHYDVRIDQARAKDLIFDLENVQSLADGSILKEDRKDVRQQADVLDCFVSETLISTSEGQKRIDKVEIGDFAATRNGYRKVVDKWNSTADVYEFTLSNGSKIICTKDHRFYTHDSGFTAICDIFEQRKKVCLQSNTTDLAIPNTQSRNIITHQTALTNTPAAFIGKCGMTLMVKFQKAFMFIIKMAMQATTRLKIWNLKKTRNTRRIIPGKELLKILSSLLSFRKKEFWPPQSGIDQKRGLNGIDKTLSIADSGTKHTDSANANSAIRVSSNDIQAQGSVQINANLHGEGKTSRMLSRLFVINAEQNLNPSNTAQLNIVQENADQFLILTECEVIKCEYIGRKTVWDITIEDEHEFFANKILVHNCFRYTVNMELNGFEKQYMLQ